MNGIGGGGTAVRLAAERERLLARFVQAASRLRHRRDAAASHDVRVALRRLEATLDLWRASLPRRRRRRAARAMRELRRALGPAREARVLVDLLHRPPWPLSPGDRAIALELARRARRRLEKAEERSAALCAKRRVRRLCARYDDAWSARGGAGEPGPAWLPPARGRVDRRRAGAGDALRAGGVLGTDEALHAARVAVKRWRYASERLEAVAPAADASTRDWLKTVQQALGRIADLRVLRGGILRWAEKHGPADGESVKPAPSGGLLEGLEAERSECIKELRRLLLARRLAPGPALAPSSSSAARVRPGD